MPKKIYTIKMGSDKLAINGKSIDEAFEAEVVKRPEVKKTDILSIRDFEKMFLESLLQQAMKDHKKLSDMNVIMDISQTIENAQDSFDIDEDDLKKYLVDPIEKVDPQPFWIKLKSLFQQLSRPEEKANEIVETKEGE